MDTIKTHLQAKHTFIVEFYADWCGPCKVYGPALKKFCAEKGIPLVQINGDNAPADLQKYMNGIPITAYPTTIVYVKGGSPKVVVGADMKKVMALLS
jgi:thioredoxin 1